MNNICLNTKLAGNEKNWVFIGDKNWHQDHTMIIYPPVWLDPGFDKGRDKLPDLYAHELAREDYAFLAHSLSDTDMSVDYKCQYGSVVHGTIVFRAVSSSCFYALDIYNMGRKGHRYELSLWLQDKSGYRTEMARGTVPHSIVPENLVQVVSMNRAEWDMSSPDWLNIRIQATGTYIRISADGQIVFELRDNMYKAGYVGLAARGPVFFQDLKVSGVKTDLAEPWDKHEGELPVFFYPGGRHEEGFNAFPVICRGHGNTVYAAWANTPRSEYYSFSNNIVFCRSEDGGKTWSAVKRIYSTGDKKVICYPASLFEHKDGCITCLTGFWDKAPVIVRSYDGGETWEDKGEFKIGSEMRGDKVHMHLYSPMQRLSDQTVIMTVYEADETGGATCSGLRDRSMLLRSTDDGYTWTEPEYIDKNNFDSNECMVLEVSPGRLVAFMRTLRAANMWTSSSADGGATWKPLEQTNISGECPYLIRHSSGALIMFNRGNGVFIKLSFDMGATWTKETRISPASAMIGMTEVEDGKILILMHEGYRMPGWIRGQFFRITSEGPEASE